MTIYAKASTFVADFHLPLLDASKWTLTAGGNTVQRLTNGTLRMTAVENNTAVTYLTTNEAYDMHTSGFFARVFIQDGHQTRQQMWVREDAPNDRRYGISFNNETNLLEAYTGVGESYGAAKKTKAYSAFNDAYWRLYLSAANIMHFQTSSDGVNWKSFYQVLVPEYVLPMKLQFRLYNRVAGTPGNGYLGLQYINTTRPVYRGPGYLREAFNGIKPGTIVGTGAGTLTGTQYGTLYLLTGTGASIYKPSGTDSILQISTGGDTHVRTSLSRGKKDTEVNVSAKMITDPSPGTSAFYIWWRMADQTSGYRLKVTSTGTHLQKVVSDTVTTMNSWNYSTTVGQEYRYKIINMGQTFYVSRSTVDEIGNESNVTTLFGSSNVDGTSSLQDAGHVGFGATNMQVQFDDLAIAGGYAPLPEAGDDLDKELNPQIPPLFYASTSAHEKFDYMRLEETGYASLVLTPSYGGIWILDFDLGWAEVRGATATRVLGDGTFDYTRYLGSKAVSMSFLCAPTTSLTPGDNRAQPATYYVELLQRWAAPHRRPVLVYKLKGQNEQRLQMRGAEFGRAIAMQDRNRFYKVSTSWVGIDGKAYETNWQSNFADEGVYMTNYDQYTAKTLGTAPTEPVVRFYGPCGYPSLINVTQEYETGEGSARITYAGTIPDGEFLELDFRTQSAYMNGIIDPAFSRLAFMSAVRWFRLNPIRNVLEFNCSTNVGDNGRCLVKWRDAFM